MFDVTVGAGSTLDGSVMSDTFTDVAPPARNDAEVRRNNTFERYTAVLVAWMINLLGSRVM